MTHSHTYTFSFVTEVLSLKKSSLDLKIPVDFEIVYFLFIVLLLHFSSKPSL